MRDIRRTLKKHLPESVATTIYYDFYGQRSGINNAIPMCPSCNLPRIVGEKAGVGPFRCHCTDAPITKGIL